MRAVPGIPSTGDPSPRWLYASNRTDDEAIDPNLPGPFTGGLRVISVGTATNADDSNVSTIGLYVHEAISGPSGLFGFDVREAVDEGHVIKHVVYAAFSHKTAQSVGLVAITVQHITGSPMQLRMTQIAEVPAATSSPTGAQGLIANPAAPGGQVLYDAASQRVFAAFGCNGMAVFDVTDPFSAPTLIAHRYPESSGPSTTWQLLRGPGTKLYISTLNNGIGVMADFQSFATSPITFYPARSQSVGIAIDPTNAQRLYLAEGTVGMGLMDLSSPPA